MAKSQKLPIVAMSGFVCFLLVSFAWYTLAYLPTQRQIAELVKERDDANAAAAKAQADEEAARQKSIDDAAKERGTLIVDTSPSGATVVIGDFSKKTPATFTDIVPGTVTMLIREDGYEDFRQDVTLTADQPVNLGTISLVQKTGNLSLSSPQSGVTYTITGPDNYEHDGTLPDKLDKLPIGDYLVTVVLQDWKLPPVRITIHDHDNAQKEIKFPYATVNIASTPSGATIRQGNKVLGQTPLTLSQVHPGEMQLSADLPPYTLKRFALEVGDFASVNKQIAFEQGKDFIAACGMPMVWITDGNFWAGKYLVRQSDLETTGAPNPSTFRRGSRPVETITWDDAVAFCQRLNDYERKAGKLPQGYHYALPSEAQWETFSADADINLAAMSRVTTLSSTQDVGASEPNKYGLYDTLGNVWEWCSDAYDDKGDHSLRGGNWLSSADNFPAADTRNGAPPKYADRFTGFRVVLVPN